MLKNYCLKLLIVLQLKTKTLIKSSEPKCLRLFVQKLIILLQSYCSKYSTFLFHFCFTHTYIYLYLSSMPQKNTLSLHPPFLPPLRPFFFHLLYMCTKGELGGFFLHRKTFHEFDRDHTKANTELGGGRRKGQVIHFHSAGDT